MGLPQTVAGLRRSAAHTPAVAYIDPDDAIRIAGTRTLLARRLTPTLERRRELTARSQQLTDPITAAENDIAASRTAVTSSQVCPVCGGRSGTSSPAST